MPTGRRIRDNNCLGNTLDNPLTAGATTFNSAGLASLGVVAAPDHAVITLDPLRQYGNPEIVVVTVHTAAATVATITRGQYGTVARSHPLGTLFLHAAVDEDFIEIVSAATRPSNPYEGQFIFETDTNKLVGYGGVDWAPRDAGGQLAGGYAQVVADQGSITTEVDLTSLTVTVTVGASRRIRISAQGEVRSTVATDNYRGDIKEGATYLAIWARGKFNAAAESELSHGQTILTPTAGVHTYKLSMRRESGSGTLTLQAAAGSAAFILVEDLGAA